MLELWTRSRDVDAASQHSLLPGELHNLNIEANNSRQNIIIMATNCYACGYRDNEVKSGGAVAPKGKKITLKVEDEEDLSRDLLKVGLVLSPSEMLLTF